MLSVVMFGLYSYFYHEHMNSIRVATRAGAKLITPNELFNCYEAEGEHCKHFVIYCLSCHRVLNVYYRHALQLSDSVWLNWRKRWDIMWNIWIIMRLIFQWRCKYTEATWVCFLLAYTWFPNTFFAIQNASWAFDVHLFGAWFMGERPAGQPDGLRKKTKRMNRLYWGIY